MDETTNAIPAGLGAWLESRLEDWHQARMPQEQKMLECYQDVMRIARDDDTKGTGMAKSRKAKGLFIGSTRNKVRAARAKINDALFGNGKLPFDTEPTNEKLAPFADAVEDIITDQLERGKFRDMLKSGVDVLATYGTGFVFGPFVRKEVLTETFPEDAGGSITIREQKYEFDLPYYELGNTLDVIPDSEARSTEDGLGLFWVTMMAPHTIQSWKDRKGYQNIDQALLAGTGDDRTGGSDRASELRGNVVWHKDGRIKVARYFGKVPQSQLSAEHMEGSPDIDYVDMIIIMAGGVVVKMDPAPWNKRPSHRCVYEAVANEMWGVGPAENNMPHQKTVNAAFRLFNEGKGMALLGTKAVDKSKFLPSEDFKKYPGKTYQFKPGLSPDEKKAAIIEFTEPDITSGWLDVIKMSEQFSDDDTGITKYTQGDDSSNLNKTAAGISMIMSASSLPIKEVIQNIDSMWIEPMIESTIEWDLKYLEVETVRKIHGDKHAEIWAQIKEFGKSSFMTWKATGTSSFMAKEVLVNKIRAFSEFAMSNPATAPLVDARELLEQTWNAMEIGKESPIVKDEQGKTNPQVQQMQQQLQQLDEVVQKMSAELDSKNLEERKLDLENRKIDLEEKKLAVEAALNSAENGVAIGDIMTRFDAIEHMLIDVMKNAGHLDNMPPPEQPNEAAEPLPAPMDPPGQPEAPQPANPPSAGFFTPDQPQ